MQDKYTIEEFAKLVGKSKRTITYWIAEEKVETILEDGRRFIVTSPEEFNKMSLVEGHILALEQKVAKLEKEVEQLQHDKKMFTVWIKKAKRDLNGLMIEKTNKGKG